MSNFGTITVTILGSQSLQFYGDTLNDLMLYKGLKGAASLPTNDLVPPIRHTRIHHSLAFQTPLAGTDINKSIFFPQTIRDWNSLTDSLISASECERIRLLSLLLL